MMLSPHSVFLYFGVAIVLRNNAVKFLKVAVVFFQNMMVQLYGGIKIHLTVILMMTIMFPVKMAIIDSSG